MTVNEEYAADSVIPPGIKARVSVEAATTFGWRKYVGDAGEMVGVDHFGASAPGNVVLREMGFTPENVAERAAAVVRRQREGRAT